MRVIEFDDEEFPESLRNLKKTPNRLYFKGKE